METHFKVIISSNIRRKKPWSRLEWIGKEKESVCLVDRHRASILYLPSGHTKRVIDAFKPYKKHLIAINVSSSGEFVVACLASGDILRWHKDSSTSTVIPACPNFSWLAGKGASQINLFVSDDGQRIVSVEQNHKVNVWEQTGLNQEGEWTNVTLHASLLTSLASKETAIDARFFSNQTQGSCFLCTFAFSDSSKVNLCFLLLRWSDDPKPSLNAPTFVTTFSRTSFLLQNLHPECRTLRIRGCYVPRLSHGGRIVSIAINQLQPYLSSMLFVDVYHHAAIASSFQHVYSQNVKALPSFTKTYWIKMMTWSYDDLFLICITGRGSLVLFNNAGEAMVARTHGMGVELGPSYFLPINPLIESQKSLNQKKDEKPLIGRPNSPISMASTFESEKSRKQKFSVTSHPRLPIILCSDGYMVTALQLTTVVTSHDIAALSLVETNHRMKMLIDKFQLNVECSPTPRYGEPIPVHDEAKFKEYKYTRLYLYIKEMFKRKKGAKENAPDEANQSKDDTYNALVYEFEKAEKEMASDTDPDSTDEAQKHPTGVIEDADEGKIMFGDYSLTYDGQILEGQKEEIRIDGETLVKKIRENISKMLSTFALLVMEQQTVEFRKQMDGAQIEDKLHLYFVDTLQSLCKLVLVGQETSLCLPWKLLDAQSNVGDIDYRDQFCSLLSLLSRNFAFLAQFNTSCTNLIWKAVEVVACSMLQLSTHAPEGCTCMRDIHNNLAAVLFTFTEVEKNLANAERFHVTSSALENPDSFYLHDVQKHSDEPPDLPQSSDTWMKFYTYLSKFMTQSSQQNNPALHKAIRLVQLQLCNAFTSGVPEIVNSPLTLSNMTFNLMTYKLDSALHLASFVLHDHLNVGSKWTDNDWRAVELLCSVMEQYFSKDTITFLSASNHSERTVSLHRDIVTEAVNAQRLSRLWNVNQCVSMLLLCGRLHDASRLCGAVGSWKTAVGIGAVVEKVRAFNNNNHKNTELSSVQDLLKARFRSLLPSWLRLNPQDPERDFVKDEDLNRDLFDFNPESLASLFVDIFTAGVMIGYDVGVWGAKELLSSLKTLCRDLPLMEDSNVYLPAPPFYLPQPTPNDVQKLALVLRHKVSVQLRILLTVFHSIGAMQHVLLWYSYKLQNERSEIRSQSKSTSKSRSNSEDTIIVREAAALATIFRDVCAILWMLHVRENLNIAARKYQDARAQGNPLRDVIEECLPWCSYMKPFAKYLNCEIELETLVLCLCSGKEADRKLVSLLAYYFCDPNSVSPKLQPRLAIVMQRLRQTTESMRSPKSDDGHTSNQPLSVLYQKQCRLMLKKQQSDKSIQNLFVRRTGEASEDFYELDLQLQSLKSSFFFESDTTYQYFIEKVFDVLHAKSDTLNRSVLQDGAYKWPEKILVSGNRREIAMAELDHALSYLQLFKYNPSQLPNESMLKEAPKHFSTPKQDHHNSQYPKNDIVQDNFGVDFELHSDVKMSETLALNHYLGDLPFINGQARSGEELAQGIFGRLRSCMNFDIADVFPAMRKRFCRLQPYITWLHYWMGKDISSKHIHLKPSIRVSVTRQQLLQSLFIAEVRFGGFSEAVLNDLISAHSSVTSVSKAELQPSAGPVLAQEETEEEMSEEKSITIIIEPPVPEEDEESDTIEEVAEITDTVVKEVVPVVEVDAPAEEEETKPKTIDEVTLRLTPIQKEEESLSELADGGSSRKHRGRSPPSSKRDNNIANVVRDEIHSVLLAQQVSLLSQILLGQTMSGNNPGAAQISTVSEILRNLQGSQAQAPGKTQQYQPVNTQTQPMSSEVDKENTRPEADTLSFIEPAVQERSVIRCGRLKKKRRDEIGIPLFHVPGITNSQEQKEIRLVRTPKSKQAWTASTIAKDRSPSPTHILAPKLLRPQQATHVQSAYVSQPPRATIIAPPPKQAFVPQSPQPQSQQLPTRSLPSTPQSAPQKTPVTTRPYKTAYPILTKPATTGFVPVRPSFQEQAYSRAPPQQQARPGERLSSYPVGSKTQSVPLFRSSNQQRPFCASFIDPCEVIAYHTKKKQTFARAKHHPSFVPIKPLPVLQMPTAPKSPIAVKPPSSKSPSPEPVSKSDEASSPKPKAQKFEGYLKQEDVNKEILLLVNQLSDSAEMLTQANAHLIGAAGKQIPSKPRMKEAGSQAVVNEEVDEEEEDFRNILTTKPLPPPPDVFARVRKDVFSVDKAKENEFLHVGDVSIDAVTRGLPHEPISIAETHLKAAKQQPCPDMSHVTGFPEEEGRVQPTTLLSEQVKEATRVAEVREVTRDRWTAAMQNMDVRLKAMDAMSKHMEDDFKAAAKLVQTIDTMGEMISPEKKTFKTSEVTTMTSPPQTSSQLHVSPRSYQERHQRMSPRSVPSFPDYPALDVPSSLVSLKTDSYKKRLQEAFNLATSEQMPPQPREVLPFAEDLETEPKRISPKMVHILDDSTQPPREDQMEAFAEEENTITEEEDRSLSDYKENLGAVLHTGPKSISRKKSEDLHARPWCQKSEREKQKVRDWMRRKQRERLSQYVSDVQKLKESESRPFQGGGVPKSTQRLKAADNKRRAKQREMLSSHMSARIDDSMKLMNQMQHDEAFNKKALRSPLRETNGRRMNEMKKPHHRAAPYPVQTRASLSSVNLSDNFDNISESSVLSAWSLNDDVKRILYGSKTQPRRSKVKPQVTFDLKRHDERSLDLQSGGTASLLDDMDWQAVDALIASLDGASDY